MNRSANFASYKRSDPNTGNKFQSRSPVADPRPDSEAYINFKKLKQIAIDSPQMAMQKYADIMANQVPILRPQMYTVMLPLFAKYGTDADVAASFQEITAKKYTITIRPFHLMIKNYIAKNQIDKAMSVLDHMDQCNVSPDVTIFGELFCALDMSKDRQLVADLFEKMKQFNIQLDTPLFNLFLKRKKEADEDINTRRPGSSLASIQTALDIIAHMRTYNLQPDARTILHLLQLYGTSPENIAHIERLIQATFPELHQYILSSTPYTQEQLQALINNPANVLIDTYNINYLMAIYSKKKDLSKMERLFAYLKNYGRVSKVSFNQLINFNLEQKNYSRVVELAENMQDLGFSMSPYDAHLYVLAQMELGQFDKAIDYFEKYYKFNQQLVQNEFINEQFSDIASLYAKVKRFDEAGKWFDLARNKGRLTRDMYQKPIKAFAEAGNPRKALELLEEVLRKHIRVEHPIFDAVMTSYLQQMNNGENLQTDLIRLLDEMRNHEIPVSQVWVQKIKSVLAQQKSAPKQ